MQCEGVKAQGALEMNEGITFIQGNTCLKLKIKSNHSAPVEWKKGPNQLQKHAHIALQHFPRTGADWRTKTYRNQKGEKIYKKNSQK